MSNFLRRNIINILQEEAIPESLKNIILLMAAGGYLVPPSQDPSKEEIWVETKKRLERFLPDLFPEIFPDASNEKPQQPQPVPAASEVASPEPPSQEPPAEEKETTGAETPTEPSSATNNPPDTGDGGNEQA